MRLSLLYTLKTNLKIFIIILLFSTISAPTLAINDNLKSKNQLLEVNFRAENINTRLDKIEDNIQVVNTPAKMQYKIKTSTQSPKINPPVNKSYQKSTEKYPAIDALEHKVFGEVSVSQNIYDRLNNLEKKVFSKTYNNELSQRVERLQIALEGKGPELENEGYAQESNLSKRLQEVESHVFKQTYESDSLNSRIARVEGHYFGQTYEDEAPIQRMDRIYTVLQVEVYKAENTSMPKDVINKTSDGVKVLSIIMFVAGFFL